MKRIKQIRLEETKEIRRKLLATVNYSVVKALGKNSKRIYKILITPKKLRKNQ